MFLFRAVVLFSIFVHCVVCDWNKFSYSTIVTDLATKSRIQLYEQFDDNFGRLRIQHDDESTELFYDRYHSTRIFLRTSSKQGTDVDFCNVLTVDEAIQKFSYLEKVLFNVHFEEKYILGSIALFLQKYYDLQQYVLSSPKFVDFGGKSTKLWNKTFPGGYEQIYVKVNGKEMIPVQLELVSTPHEISVQYLSLPDDEPLYWRIPSSCARFQWDPTEPKNTATFLKTFETRIEVSELRYEMDHPLKMHKLHVMYNSADRIVSIQSNRTNGIMVLHLDYAYQYTRYTLLNGNEMCDVRYGNFELIELIKSDLDIFGFISNLKLFRYHGREMIRDRVCDVFVHRDQNEMGTFVQTELYLAPNGRALTDSPYDPVVIRRLHESNYYINQVKREQNYTLINFDFTRDPMQQAKWFDLSSCLTKPHLREVITLKANFDKDFNREVLQFQSTLRSSLIKRLHFTTQLSSINFPKVEFTPYADHVEVEILHIYLLRPIVMFTPLTNYLIDSKKLPVHYVQDGIEECAKLAFTMHKKALKFCPANRCFVLDQKEYEQRKIWVEHTDSTDEYESDEEEEEEGKDNTNLDGCEVLLYAEQFDKLIANVPLSYGNIKVQNFQLCLNAFDQLNCLTFYQVPTRTSWSLEEGDSNAKHDQLLNVQWAGKQIGTEKMTISETQLLVANPQHCYRLCLQQHEQNSTFCQAFQACRYPSSSRWKYTCDFLSLDQLTLLLSSEHDQHKTLLVDNHHCSVYRPNARNHFVQLNQVSIQSDLKPIKVDRDVELIEECIDKCWNRMGNQCRTLIAKLESTDNLNETVIIKRDQHQECQYFNQELFNVNLAQNRQQKLSHSSNSVAFIKNYLNYFDMLPFGQWKSENMAVVSLEINTRQMCAHFCHQDSNCSRFLFCTSLSIISKGNCVVDAGQVTISNDTNSWYTHAKFDTQMCEMYEIGAKIEYQQVKRHSDSISFAVIVPADQGLNTPSGLISTNDEPQVSHSLLSAWILAFVVCSALIGGCTLGIVVDTKRRKMSMKRKASEFLLHFVNSADA